MMPLLMVLLLMVLLNKSWNSADDGRVRRFGMKQIGLAAQICAAFLLFAPVCAAFAQDDSEKTEDSGVRLETVSVLEDAEPESMFDPGAASYVDVKFDAPIGREAVDVLARVPSVRASSQGNRLGRASVGYRGAAPQDVVVRYEGVAVNALSDASADLSLIPAALIARGRLTGSAALGAAGADGALIDLYGESSETPLSASISASSLKDFSLFGRGIVGRDAWGLDGAVFGDLSPGRFAYRDAQGTHRIREHNAASRLGGQLKGHVDLKRAQIEAFSFFSRVAREEAGLSEFPARYRDASEALWLSLSQVRGTFAPVRAGRADMIAGFAVSHRAFENIYDNPTALIGSRPVHTAYLENQTSALVDMQFLAGSWSQTVIQAGYDRQSVALAQRVMGQEDSLSVTDHVLMLSVTEKMSFLHDTVMPSAGVRMDWKIGRTPQISPYLGMRYVPHRTVALLASVSMTGRYPSFDELYYRTEFLRGKASLRAQRAVMAELGVTYQPVESFKLMAVGFYHQYWDLIRFMPVTSYLYEAANLPESRASGVEITADALLWGRLSLLASYNFTHARVGDRPLPGVAAHQVRGAVAYRDAIFDMRFEASYHTPISRNLLGTSFIGEQLRLNIVADMKLYDGLHLSMAIYNLLDDRSSEDVLQRPLAGRHAFVGLRFAPPLEH